jgi:hypothetical protein
MDNPYDHIQEEVMPNEDETTPKNSQEQTHPTLNEDLQEAYKAISTSTWGAKIGGFLGTVVKQVRGPVPLVARADAGDERH